MSMGKRVYGVLGISSEMSNWNADFTGYPKTITDGRTFGSDKAYKYPIKFMWNSNGEKVLYIKSIKIGKSKKSKEPQLVPRTLKERYEHLFEVEDLSKCKDIKEVLVNLFKCIDIKNFGATFAESGKNISITGAVQIGQGFNKYEDTNPEEQQILSPFRDAKDDEAKNSTLGTKIVSDEAHYFYPFCINPNVYNEYIKLGVTDGYTEEDYKKFKEAALTAATSYSTNAKIGCENEFGLFVETEKDLYLPDLSKYISFYKEEKNIIEINCGDLLNSLKDKILDMSIYVNPYTTDIKHDLENVKVYNIFTRKEV